MGIGHLKIKQQVQENNARMLFKIHDPSSNNDVVSVSADTAEKLIEEVEEHCEVNFCYFDLYEDGIRLTQSLKFMKKHLHQFSELTIVKHDKPIRILDENIVDVMADFDDHDIYSVWGHAHEVLENDFGPVEDWDVSFITDMSHWFASSDKVCDFNEDISKWDVSSVTNMDLMFDCNTEFNQPLFGMSQVLQPWRKCSLAVPILNSSLIGMSQMLEICETYLRMIVR